MQTIVGLLRFLLWLVPAMTYARSPQSLPTFHATELILDTLTPGDTGLAVFTFVNTMDDTLVLEQVSSECGCIVGEIAKRRYAPGDSGAVSVAVRTSGTRNVLRRTITLTFRASVSDTTMERSSAIVLTVTVPLRPSVRFVPEILTGLYTPGRGSQALSGALLNESAQKVVVEALALDTPTVLEMLTRPLPHVLASGERLPFAVWVNRDGLCEGVTAIRSRVRARVRGSRYAVHTCDVYLYLE